MHNLATAQIFTQQAYKAKFNKRRVSDKRRGSDPGLLSIFFKSIADIRYRYRLKKYRRYRYRYFAVKNDIEIDTAISILL